MRNTAEAKPVEHSFHLGLEGGFGTFFTLEDGCRMDVDQCRRNPWTNLMTSAGNLRLVFHATLAGDLDLAKPRAATRMPGTVSRNHHRIHRPSIFIGLGCHGSNLPRE